MPRLIGLVNRFQKSVILDAMAGPITGNPSTRTQQIRQDEFSAVLTEHSKREDLLTSASPDGRYSLILFGQFFEKEYASSQKPAELLLTQFLQGGKKKLLDLNGEYLILLWDRIEKSIWVTNDRLGIKSFYYFSNLEHFLFATELKSLAGISEVSRELDPEALIELLALGHFQSPRSLLKDIPALAPASELTWKNGRLEISTYWSMAYQQDSALQNDSRAVESYYEVLKQALELRVAKRNRIGILLSGGLDSRAIAGILQELRPNESFLSWTTGHGHDHDCRYGKKIARAIRSTHQEINIPETFLQDFGPDYVWDLDGEVAIDGCHRAILVNSIQDQTDVVLNGFLGDVLAGTNLLEKTRNAHDFNEIADIGFQYYLEGLSEAALQKFLKPSVYAHGGAALKESFRGLLRTSKAENLRDQLGALTLKYHLQGDSRAQYQLLSQSFHVVSPFIDKQVIDFILRLPIEQRVARKAYIQMICRYFPKLAKVPRAGDGLPLIRSRMRAAFTWRWNRFYRATLPKLSGGKLGGHSYAQYVHRKEWYSKANAEFIRTSLLSEPYLEDLVNMDELRTFVSRSLDPKNQEDSSKAISCLLTLSIFRQRLAKIPSVSLTQSSRLPETEAIRL